MEKSLLRMKTCVLLGHLEERSKALRVREESIDKA